MVAYGLKMTVYSSYLTVNGPDQLEDEHRFIQDKRADLPYLGFERLLIMVALGPQKVNPEVSDLLEVTQ